MIVQIEPSHSNTGAPLHYNEKKMSAGQDGVIPGLEKDGSHVVTTRNVPQGTTLEEEFERLKTKNIKNHRGRNPKNFAFHMSVNPSETDKDLSDAEAAELIGKIMETLGYAAQPYRIYRHADIEREHFHVVSVRSGQDGKIISDSFERLVLRKRLRELSKEYGFEIVLNAQEKAIERKKASAAEKNGEEERKDEKKTASPAASDSVRSYVPPFSRESAEPVTEQLRKAHEDIVSQWSLTSFEQYAALMLRRYGFLVEFENDYENISAQGLSKQVRPCTPRLADIELTRRMHGDVASLTGRSDMKKKRAQRERVMKLSEAAAGACSTFAQFRALMERKGVYVVVSWTKDGSPFGVTYLDKATKCAWKGSEVSRDIRWLMATASEKGWEIGKDRSEDLTSRRLAMPSRVRILKTQTGESPDRPNPISPGPENAGRLGMGRIVPGGRSRMAVLKETEDERFRKDGPLGDNIDRDEIDRDEIGRNR